jgi:hypothetical protein
MLPIKSRFCEDGNEFYGSIEYGKFLNSLMTNITPTILYQDITELPEGMEIVKIVKIDLTPKLL